MDLNPHSITSINWNDAGTHIAVGNTQGTTEIWDAMRSTKLFEVGGH